MGEVRELFDTADPALAEVVAALRRVPAEALLDGPPPDGELVLRRALRRLREEQAPPRRA